MNGTLLNLSRGVGRVVVFATGVLLVLAGVFKLQEHDAFRSALVAHGVLPLAAVPAVAWGVCVVELACEVVAVWCVVQRRWLVVRCGAVLCAGMFLCLALYSLVLVFDPPPAPTSCACLPGEKLTVSWRPIVVRDGSIASILAVVGVIGAPRVRPAPRPKAAPRP